MYLAVCTWSCVLGHLWNIALFFDATKHVGVAAMWWLQPCGGCCNPVNMCASAVGVICIVLQTYSKFFHCLVFVWFHTISVVTLMYPKMAFYNNCSGNYWLCPMSLLTYEIRSSICASSIAHGVSEESHHDDLHDFLRQLCFPLHPLRSESAREKSCSVSTYRRKACTLCLVSLGT